MTRGYEGSSMIICSLRLCPPQVKERDKEKKGMKNRGDADRGWNSGKKSKYTEHSAAREWLNDPIPGSLLDTRQRCMKIDTQVLDSVCRIIKRIDIILRRRMKTKLSYSILGLVRGGKSSSVAGYGSIFADCHGYLSGALWQSVQLMVTALP